MLVLNVVVYSFDFHYLKEGVLFSVVGCCVFCMHM